MMDFIEYVVAEFQRRRLSKADALDLLGQFSHQAPAIAHNHPQMGHPLLHRNESDLSRQCYRSIFDGTEFFLDDHQIAMGGEPAVRMLPAVVYLEMARAALVDALPGLDADAPVQLDDVVWSRPIVAAPRAEVRIALSVDAGADADEADDPTVRFEVLGAAADADVHCCGIARVARASRPARLDIASLEARMHGTRLDAAAIYAAYRTMGMRFGPAHQAIECVSRGPREALARLALPAHAGARQAHGMAGAAHTSLGAFRLHPSMLDGALQASIGLLDSLDTLPRELSLPFSLDSLRVFAECTPRMYAWIRYADDETADRFDIDLCDDAGDVCATLRGFATRTLSKTSGTTTAGDGVVIARPVWHAAPRQARGEAPHDMRHLVLAGARLPVPLDALQAALPGAVCKALPADGQSVAERYAAAALACFDALRAVIDARVERTTFVHLVIADTADERLLAGLSGLLQSAAREASGRLAVQVMLVAAELDAERLATQLGASARPDAPPVVRCLRDTCETRSWAPLADDPESDFEPRDPLPAFAEHGTYLITGGLGGLGTLFAREILARTHAARVVLTGRAQPSAQIDAKLDALAPDVAMRARVAYRSMNLLDADDVRRTIDETLAQYGRLHGVLHAAGMICDGLLAHKSVRTFEDVLAPKVHGTMNLDQATAHTELDFFVLFSSAVSVAGNAGQGDYAAANGFLDEFASYREDLVPSGARHGKTLAIDWALWADGGMRMPSRIAAALREASGMVPLQTRSGMTAFARSMASPHARTVVIEGELARIRRALFGTATADALDAPVVPSDARHVTDAPALADATRDYLRKRFAEQFGMPYHQIDAHAPLEQYGIDSIVAVDLTRQLEKTFGPLSKTLFFEHQSIDELTQYFLRVHSTTLETLFALPRQTQASAPVVPVVAGTSRAVHVRRGARRSPAADRPGHEAFEAAEAAEPIAIVGLSGRYPQAPDLDAYWRNLSEGRDCIVEIPRERWDWREYYSTERTRVGAHYSRWGGFIDGVDEFDPLFFHIPPVDAERIDPQERLFLQHAWMAIEDAGYTRASLQIPHAFDLPGQVGVYVGVMYGEYQLFGVEAGAADRRIAVPVSYASIANRVSYFLNLHGPSLTLDSMCSSSLTAIHLACEDLRSGRTSLALAGGVNVTIHPNKYLILSAGQYISSDGHCQSFGEGSDGYIPGEGVGVAVLKRLADAERDGNPIYGMIRGSAVNHGGKTNGYSVPNPKAQTSVVRAALRRAGVDPRRVSYIEAHGTGTKLGDPIEIAALAEVFRDVVDARPACAIGSVKSNIGHCESAAGIAGLTKVLLQMRHRQIAPSLHSAVLNPHIDFAATPFFVNQTLAEWATLLIDGRALPRVAGVSSFGAGGSNAHLIVEEYMPARTEPAAVHTGRREVIVPLSARTHAQLSHKARDLLAFLERVSTSADAGVDLSALAYTLQVGREGMDARVAFLVDSRDALLEKLRAYCNGKHDIDGCFDATDARAQDEFAALSHDEDMLSTVERWIARGKFERLARLWVNGFTFDWRGFYGAHVPRLLSLPAYPFAKERYWIARDAAGARRTADAVHLHPLLHANASDLFQQRYTACFTGDEAFLADHRIDVGAAGAHKVLPAAAYLEMARAAVEFALPADMRPVAWDIRDIAWVRPLVVDAPVHVAIELTAGANSRIDFAVYSNDGDARIEHCQGHALPLAGEPASAPAVDLAALRGRITARACGADEVYGAFAAMGIHYGSSFRTVRTLACGVDEVLAELALDDVPERALPLPPGLLDGALQASLGLVADWACLPDTPAMPFALDSLIVFGECAPRMFAWVRHAPDDVQNDHGHGQHVTRLDIDLCDADGRVRIRASGLALRAWRAAAAQPALIAQPVWESITLDETTAPPEGVAGWQVVLCDLPNVDAGQLAVQLGQANNIAAAPLALPAPVFDAERYRAAALACVAHLRALAAHAAGADATGTLLHYQLVIDGRDDALLAGLSGLIDTACSELPHVRAQLVLTDDAVDTPTLAAQLSDARRCAGERLLRFGSPTEGAVPCVRRWRAQRIGGAPSHAFRDDGVYLITGGLGGLGQCFAREILSRTTHATVILTGRAELDDPRRTRMRALTDAWSVDARRLVYRRVDLASATEVDALVANIVEVYGTLDGVLHSAGMLNDSLIVNKTDAAFADVLEPKVCGTVHLDGATRELDLAFFVLFSSIAASFGNVGQADYAAANGFMDRFAAQRNALVAAGERRGRTRSIGWPLWQEGGMRIDADAAARLASVSGMEPMRTATGMHAFAAALAGDAAHIVVAAGDVERLRRVLDTHGAAAPVEPVFEPDRNIEPDPASDALRERAARFVADEFAALLRLRPDDVDRHAPLERYGIDSVLAMQFIQRLEQRFGTLSKTLLFEYQTLAALAHYLADAFPQHVRARAGSAPASAPQNASQNESHLALQRAGRWPLPPPRPRLPAPRATQGDAVAIVGVAGRYPEADDLQSFWRNLRDGRDCISEVPPQRWDHALIFDPQRNRPGKTYSRWGGFLNGVDLFDPLLFGISPREAELMDPQERLFLEVAWETLEDAGYSKASFAGQRVGVYVGAMWGQYELYGAQPGQTSMPSSSFASIANRVSYFFDFHGPSLALDSMCSSSLSALHLAIEAVRNGTLDAALAGGVNVTVHPDKYLLLSQGGFVSSDGRCRSFGAGGDGYVPGEGVGAVLLKPLSRALADGDQIYAVVKASALNHGGKTNGYTVPNPVAQAELIRDTLAQAGVAPHDIDYVETHGTGTSLGDPIEIAGLTRAFVQAAGATPLPPAACAIGSVKSNIGHLESAAGIAAVTKVLLQFRHRQFAPSLHAEVLNPHIDFGATPFRVQTALADWPQHAGRPPRACVSSFGAGGANAHLILEAFDDARLSSHEPRPEVFLLSARDRTSLRAYAHKLLAFVEQAGGALPWADIAYTLQVGRTLLDERVAIIAADPDALRDKLAQWLDHTGSGAAAPHDVHAGSVRDGHNGASALIEGEAGAALVRVALQQRDLTKLAKLWVAGVEIDWTRLHAAGTVRRVSLPTYPFAKERYWIASAGTSSASQVGTLAPQLTHYAPVWRIAELPPLAASVGGAPALSGVVLLVDATDAFAAAFARAAPVPIVVAASGDAYRELNGDRFTFDPMNEAGVDRLLETLRQRSQVPQAIVHCIRTDGDTEQQLERGIFTLHALCRALLRNSARDGVRIVSLRISDTHAPLHDATAGYLRSLALETPRLAGKTLALSASMTPDEAARHLAAELDDAAWRDGEVRYTASDDASAAAITRREVRRIERVAAPSIDAISADAGAAIRHGGVYLITGGLGGLGYALSEHLAKTCRARLVLSGRSALDATRERRLAQLREHGGDAIYVQADVADSMQTEALVAAAKQRFARLDGVIHCAGVHCDSLARNKTRPEMKAVFAAKIAGTIHLDLATRDEPLDLFVLFSSVAGVAGSVGQTDYAYANRFVDAYADERAARARAGTRRGKTLSIGWPFWEAGGMSIATDEIERMRARTGLHPLPTELGLLSWEHCISSAATQIIPLYGEPARIEAFVATPPEREASASPDDIASAAPLPSDAALERAVAQYLKRLLSEQIKLSAERIDTHAHFDTFGVDSIIASQLNAALEQDIGALPKTLLYEYPSIGELAAHLLDRARPALQRLLAPSAVAAADAPKDAGDHAEHRAANLNAPPIRVDEKIAIIGIHARLPGSAHLDALWDNLRAGRDLIRDVPADRWDASASFDPDPDHAEYGCLYHRWGGFLDDIDAFDAAFFGIAPDEAALIDPQERLFLQSVWHAFEDAGYTRDALKRRYPKERSADVGVFCGVTTHSYQMLAQEEWQRGNMAAPASMPWSIANRVSYVFDFQGPSMPVDTACSSSLVAIHLAAESLRRGECQVAVAGGVNLYLHPSKYYSLCRRRMLARGPQCRSYGAGDDGFVPGEGVGSVVLKPLSRALADGDCIHGIIAASAYEHGGRANGYAAPNPNAQARLIARSLNAAGLPPDAIGYVEGHGTGTQLGDCLEVAALTNAFSGAANSKLTPSPTRRRFCALGSVKSNVGHAESAAGMASLAKVLLQFRHGQFVPTLHARDPNPDLDLEASPFYLQHDLAAWPAPDGAPRRALINAFGAGGVNACLIVEEHVPARDTRVCSGAPQLIVLSARSDAQLREYAGRLHDALVATPDVSLDALAYTLQTGREAFDERLAIIAADGAALAQELALARAGTASAGALRGRTDPRGGTTELPPHERERLRAQYASGDLQQLARYWIEGAALNWDEFVASPKPARVSLPGYPFENTRYRLSDTPPRTPAASRPARLHPLVAGNVSTLRAVSFASRLSADAWYALDHRIGGVPLFPGAGFVEMACAAGTLAGERTVGALEDVVWHRPLPLTAGEHLVKTIFKASDDGADFVTVSFDDDNERVVHAEGRVVYAAPGAHTRRGALSPPVVPIDALRAQALATLTGEQCYEALACAGLAYGPSLRTIQSLYIGDGFALSALRIADASIATFGQYLLHPALIDGALQTVLGVASAGDATVLQTLRSPQAPRMPRMPLVPFALGSIERVQPLRPACYAYARLCDAISGAPDIVHQFDIQLLGPHGDVLVSLERLYMRALVPDAAHAVHAAAADERFAQTSLAKRSEA